MKKMRMTILLASLALLISASSAFAILIDFTDGDIFGVVNGKDKVTIANPYGAGFDLVLKARKPDAAWLTYNRGDGIGIHEFGFAGWEYDEIEWDEVFAVKFKKDGKLVSAYLDQIYLTDLFSERNYFEQGKYKLYDDGGWSDWTMFSAASNQVLGSSNGILSVVIAENVKGIKFGGVKSDGYGKYEYSVAGMEVNPTPEPATMLLLGSGMVSLAVFGRKKLKK